MRTIGLIGGMSWESTLIYYRLINEAVRRRRGGLSSAEIALRSLDFARVVALQTSGRWDLAGDLLGETGAELARAGAGCALICTNTMHLVADRVAERAGIPLLDIIDVTAAALAARGVRRPLLLATRYTMEHGFYADRMAAHGIEVVTPEAEDRATVHDVIFGELCRGEVRPASRDAFLAIARRGLAAGADGVILGCTEICMLVEPATLLCPVFDSTALHAEAAVAWALGEETPLEAPLARAA